ncbi:MAG: hypothetical protein WCO35_03500 [Candidatus Nomurabacteria bacterium]
MKKEKRITLEFVWIFISILVGFYLGAVIDTISPFHSFFTNWILGFLSTRLFIYFFLKSKKVQKVIENVKP